MIITSKHTAIAYVNAKMQTLPVESCGRDASKDELEANPYQKGQLYTDQTQDAQK